MRLDGKTLNRGVASAEYPLTEGRRSWGQEETSARVQSPGLWAGGGATATKAGTEDLRWRHRKFARPRVVGRATWNAQRAPGYPQLGGEDRNDEKLRNDWRADGMSSIVLDGITSEVSAHGECSRRIHLVQTNRSSRGREGR